MAASREDVLPQDLPLDTAQRERFGRELLAWFGRHARDLPWRGTNDPYRTWVSEIMLQQTRVTAVVEHYHRFLERFPTAVALALAPEDQVLALWSGLGYYRRARMLHRAAKFLLQQHGGTLPHTAAELRKLPGIGVYTSAAIASIAFGEPVAVVDGNVERVLLRIAGRAEQAGKQATDFVAELAQALIATDDSRTAPGDHNQAMMELGATVCLPRGPLCLQCPVCNLCRTRGEHVTLPRNAMRSERVAYAITTRKPRSGGTEILLHRRDAGVSLMPGMLELPQIVDVPESQPRLRLRHAIVGTNYYVEVFALGQRREVQRRCGGAGVLMWTDLAKAAQVPLTGLTRKVLQRTGLMQAEMTAATVRNAADAFDAGAEVPLLTGRHSRAMDDLED